MPIPRFFPRNARRFFAACAVIATVCAAPAGHVAPAPAVASMATNHPAPAPAHKPPAPAQKTLPPI